MKIKALKIKNYKGFHDSGFVELSESWNVIVGQNNAGKTAFIEGFRLNRNEDKPHKNITFARDFPLPSSSFIAQMRFSREWVKNCWLRQDEHFSLPFYGNTSAGSVQIDPNKFWEGADLQVEFEFLHSNRGVTATWPSHRLFEADRNPQYMQFHRNADRKSWGSVGPFGGDGDTLPKIIQQNYAARIYMFEAKRFALGECGHQDTTTLAPDAANLPAVLSKIQANPALFAEFNQNVSTIFPSIKWVTVTPKGNNFEIRIWSIDPDTKRDDLAVPLNESGTGVGQVLAILYVAMTNDSGVIAIDEPNSFLHPGAAKKLIQILKRYPQHQYIISTHSPEVISAAQPAKLHLVKFDGQQSVIESYKENEIEVKRMMLEEVGASLSDIFSAERVIWVEGPTERECFDFIATNELNKPGLGQTFVALRNTGDLDGKQADAALDIYDALTKGGSILPVSVWFSFDNEGKTDRQVDDLNRRCGGRAKFLPRRMTENYLLHPAAIVAVLTGLGESGLQTAAIEELLQKHAKNRMKPGIATDYGTLDFLVHVDGAKLLMDVFSEVSDTRHSYRKVRDGVELLKVILKVDRKSVVELIDFVNDLIS
jgi:predicted ATPase